MIRPTLTNTKIYQASIKHPSHQNHCRHSVCKLQPTRLIPARLRKLRGSDLPVLHHFNHTLHPRIRHLDHFSQPNTPLTRQCRPKYLHPPRHNPNLHNVQSRKIRQQCHILSTQPRRRCITKSISRPHGLQSMRLNSEFNRSDEGAIMIRKALSP